MPLYEVPVLVKVAAPSAVAAHEYLWRDSDALESLSRRGLLDVPVDPDPRALREDELGVGGYTIGQVKRLKTWRDSAPVLMEHEIKEPPA